MAKKKVVKHKPKIFTGFIQCPSNVRKHERVGVMICMSKCDPQCTPFLEARESNPAYFEALGEVAQVPKDQRTEGGVIQTEKPKEKQTRLNLTKWGHRVECQAGLIDVLFVEGKSIEVIAVELDKHYDFGKGTARARVLNHLYHLARYHEVEIPGNTRKKKVVVEHKDEKNKLDSLINQATDAIRKR